ncbi:MAG: MATE family efflux transporter [Sarcina sp.]
MNSFYKKVLRKKFINYLIPSVCAMWLFSLYTIIDGIFVGRYVGASALAAVNISMPFINLIFAFSILFSIGTSTVISIYLGKKNLSKANSIFSLGLFSIICVSIIIFLIVYFNLNTIALFLGAKTSTLTYVLEYLKTIVFFNGFFMISYYFEVLCKTDGSPYLSIIGVSFAALTNILLDYIFVGILGMGVSGAAFATGLSQLVSGIIFLSHFLSKKSTLKLTKFKFDFLEIKRILSIGLPDSLTELATGIVILIFNKCILIYIGNNGVIAYSIISYVNSLVIMSMIAVSQGMQPLVSYYYGKASIISIKYILKLSLIAVSILSIISFLSVMIFTSDIVKLFITSTDIAVINLSIKSLKIFSFSFLLLGFNILFSGFLSSIEKPSLGVMISLSRGLIVILLTLIIIISIFGGTAIWIVTPISELLCFILSINLIKQGFNKRFETKEKMA